MAVRLTEGAISLISTGNRQPTEFKPVIQVMDVRAIQTQTVSAERFRVCISDGLFYQHGMLATQLNGLIRSQLLQKGSVVRLKEFVVNTIRERTIIIIIDVDVILSNCAIIGDAKPYPSFGNEPLGITPIAALNPYQGMWTIKARVIAKDELRRYNAAKGDCKVFSFDLVDSDGGEIRTTCFNAVADQFYGQIKVGKVYFISNGNIKPAQKAFNHLKNDQEITLDHTSTVQHCIDDDGAIPQQFA